MLKLIVGIVTLPLVIAADLLRSGSSKKSDGGDGSYDCPSGRDSGDRPSRNWTANEIAVQNNINAGMGYKED